MITETMLLLAIRQKNWRHAVNIAEQLSEKRDNSLFKPVLKTTELAEKGNIRAEYLLKIWAEIKWKEIN